MTAIDIRTGMPPLLPSNAEAGSSGRAGLLRPAVFAAVLLLGAAPAAAQPNFVQPGLETLAVDQLVSFAPVGEHGQTSYFDQAGTNPRFTNVSFFPTEYYDSRASGVRDGRIYLRTKPSADLRALPSPPPNPFSVDVRVTMTNDEGETASGTITFRTFYDNRASSPLAGPAQPVFAQAEPIDAPPGASVPVRAEEVFDDAGTNPRFTDVTFSTHKYFHPNTAARILSGRLFVRMKTAVQLGAMTPPPPNPYSVIAEVTMANDEGQTAIGAFNFETYYKSTPDRPLVQPTLGQRSAINAPPGVRKGVDADPVFLNQGTNAKFTRATFSTMEYYRSASTGISNGTLYVQPKTAAELNLMSPPPPSPFTVSVDVTMTNYEGQTGTGTLKFRTTYARDPKPVPAQDMTVSVIPDNNTATLVRVGRIFDNAGKNPRFTAATFSNPEYFDPRTGIEEETGLLVVRSKSIADLRALPSPPPSVFTSTAEVSMTNDQGYTAKTTITLRSRFDWVERPE